MMTTSRDAFLNRVRQAVAEGNRAGGTPPLPARGGVGYQGAGADPVARLRDELAAAGGQLHVVEDEAKAVSWIRVLLEERNARRVLIGSGPYLDRLDLAARLAPLFAVQRVADLTPDDEREAFFAADVGISGVDAVVAETGTIALETRRDQPRSLSLLPPAHIAVAWREQVAADLFDLFVAEGGRWLPACLSLITGPSKTGDIELKLVTGVHGPGVVHLVLIARPAE
jgi:L-lactate dehydrogenase complex protein LldG